MLAFDETAEAFGPPPYVPDLTVVGMAMIAAHHSDDPIPIWEDALHRVVEAQGCAYTAAIEAALDADPAAHPFDASTALFHAAAVCGELRLASRMLQSLIATERAARMSPPGSESVH